MFCRVLRLSAADQRLLASAALRLAATQLALAAMPGRCLRAGNDGRVSSARRRSVAGRRCGVRGTSVARLQWAVRHASRIVPNATCLTRALVLRHLLRRHGYMATVQIGVAKQLREHSADHATACANPLTAHAWVELEDGTVLDDGEKVARYSRLLSLTDPQIAP